MGKQPFDVNVGYDCPLPVPRDQSGDPDVMAVIPVLGEDAMMAAAIQEARRTASDFIRALKVPLPSRSWFNVKVQFSEGEITEHIWVSSVSHDGKRFHGIISNAPNDLRGIHEGDDVSVEDEQISDWMFVENGKLVGGHTLRVLLQKMSPQERADYKKALPFDVD